MADSDEDFARAAERAEADHHFFNLLLFGLAAYAFFYRSFVFALVLVGLIYLAIVIGNSIALARDSLPATRWVRWGVMSLGWTIAALFTMEICGGEQGCHRLF